MRHSGKSWWQEHSTVSTSAVTTHSATALKSLPRPDLVVVGAGVAGLSCATVAANAGMRVVVIDVGGVGSGAAGRNGGLLLAGFAKFFHDAVAMYGADLATRGYQITLDELARMRAQDVVGMRWLGSSRRAFDRLEQADLIAHHEALTAAGFASEMRADNELYLPDDALFHPIDRVQQLAAHAVDAGVTIVVGRHFKHVEEVRQLAPNVAVCVDGGLDKLVPQLALYVQSHRLQMIGTAPTKHALDHGIYRRYGMDYAAQAADGSLLLGGFRDADMASAINEVASPSDAVTQLLRAWAHELAGPVKVVSRWAGACAWTNDYLPICQELEPRLWACGAYAGTGNVWSALCGRALGSAITGHQPHNLATLDLIQTIRERSSTTVVA